jgi:hypothetical protein
MNTISQADFDRLTLYVAVASELRNEPFLSEDNNRERLIPSNDGQFFAHFCHPAFLKSAMVPFRKLWLGSEKCAFERVRDLIFRIRPDPNPMSGNHFVFHDAYSQELTGAAGSDWGVPESRKDIVDIWINTQGFHAGQREKKDGKIANPNDWTPQDFDEWANRIGREKFEFLFRICLRSIGGFYVQFLDRLVAPLFWSLRRGGMTPGFEAGAALKYNPYPDPHSRITFDDVFWHLNKESMEETFERLLDRASYLGMKCIVRAFFRENWPATAIAAVCESADFPAFLAANGGRILEGNEKAEGHLREAVTNSALFGVIRVEVYEGRQVRLTNGTPDIFPQIYEDFRSCLFAERKSQRPRQRL